MKKINLNSIEGLTALKESLNNVIENKIGNINNTDAINSIKRYDFGSLKYLFENMLDKLYLNEDTTKMIGKYAKLIKESKGLKNTYQLSKLLKETANVEDANLFLMSTLNLNENISNKELEKLRNLVTESAKMVGISKDEIDTIKESYSKTIDSSISYVLSENVTKRNVAEYSGNLSKVLKHIEGNKKDLNEAVGKTENELIKDLENMLNEQAENTPWLCDLSRRIFYNGLNGGDNKALFEDYKNDCIKILDENIENLSAEESSRFSLMKEQLSGKIYNENTFGNDIAKLAELKSTLMS